MQQHIGWIATVVNHSTQFDWLEAHTVLFFFFFKARLQQVFQGILEVASSAGLFKVGAPGAKVHPPSG